jgi:voltage-gated potassium channel
MLVFTLATMLLGAAGVYVVEVGQNGAIKGFGDAVWWAIVTSTTVGYGDVSPVTTEGRLIAVVLMLTGIGLVGVFTARVASLFVKHDSVTDVDRLAERLGVLERKLDLLLHERGISDGP